MNPGFCGECCYLSITEEEQNKIRPTPEHICNKYNVKLYHLIYHPKILRCNQCVLHPGLIYSDVIKNSFGEPGIVYNSSECCRDETGSHYSMYNPKDVCHKINGEDWLFGGRPEHAP